MPLLPRDREASEKSREALCHLPEVQRTFQGEDNAVLARGDHLLDLCIRRRRGRDGGDRPRGIIVK
jgi:hypothetical protein